MTQFGRPALALREGSARKVQFSGPACVLDAYLYPARDGAEPVVTHVDARLPDGREMDRSSCVAAPSAAPTSPASPPSACRCGTKEGRPLLPAAMAALRTMRLRPMRLIGEPAN